MSMELPVSLGLEPACAAPATWAAAARTVSMVSPDPQYSQPFAVPSAAPPHLHSLVPQRAQQAGLGLAAR